MINSAFFEENVTSWYEKSRNMSPFKKKDDMVKTN